MRIFHGSKDIIEQPVFGAGKPNNDYGLGFYCTEERHMAREWAVDERRDGFVNAYDLDTDGLTVLKLGGDEYTALHWLAVLLENREFAVRSALGQGAREYLLAHFIPPYRHADIIIGYRADDSYFSFAQDFIDGTLSYQRLKSAMYLGKLGQQVVLKSKRSFDRIRFIEAEAVSAKDWYPKRQSRDLTARRDYLDVKKHPYKKGELYMTQILDEEVIPDDPRLR